MDAQHCVEIVLSYTTSGKDLKNFMLVNKLWYKLSLPLADKFCNHLMTLLKFLPTADWDYRGIFLNPNFRLEYFKDYQSFPMEILGYIAGNINITIEFMKEYSFITWNMFKLSCNPAPKEGGIWNIVKAFPNLDWEIDYLSVNKSITWDIIKNNPDGINGNRWTEDMFANPNIFQLGSFEAIKNNGILPVDYRILSYNRGVWYEDPISIINNNPGDWDYEGLIGNLQISYNDIMKWKNIHGFDECLSIRKDLTWEFIKNNKDIKWNRIELLRNKNLPLSCIQKKFAGEHLDEWGNVLDILKMDKTSKEYYSGHSRSWYYLSENPNLTYKFVMNNLDKPWCFRAMSDNLFA